MDGLEFNNSPEFFRMREFERTCHVIQGVSFLGNETYEVKELDVMLKGSVQEKWDRNEKKTKRQFFVNRLFRYSGCPDGLDTIEDAVRLMLEKDIGHLPIVDNKGRLVGIVDREDILKALIK